MQAFRAVESGVIEVLPLVLLERAFPARPSSLPDIRDFVRRRLNQTPFSEDDLRAIGEQVLDLLLDVAGPSGAIQVSLRIFPGHAEIDVLPIERVVPPAVTRLAGPEVAALRVPAGVAEREEGDAGVVERLPGPSTGGTFADWLAGALRRESMTMEAAARQLQVSVKTVSRWVGGTTEPRLRDLSRMREIFGELPFP